MATVTVYTAEHMKDIEDKSVVSGAVSGDSLILTQHDGTLINAGNVRGPKGTNGAAGYTSIVVCSSTSRPTGAARFNGLAIFETDTNKFLIWNGIRWDPPWNQPWGLMGYVQRTTDAGPMTGGDPEASIAGMSVAVTVVANRRLKITFEANTFATAGTDVVTMARITEDATGITTGSSWSNAAGYATSIHAEIIRTPTPGVHNYYIRMAIVGYAAGMMMGRPDSPMALTIEDLGPNGPPA